MRGTKLQRMASGRDRVHIPAEALTRALAHYEEGLYLQAASVLEPFGPAGNWAGPDARIFGGRLAQNLGAQRLSNYLYLETARANPSNAQAQLFAGYHAMATCGPWHAWVKLRNFEAETDHTPNALADIYALRGRICASFRDAEEAGRWFDKALELTSHPWWILTELSCAQASLDEFDEALKYAERAVEQKPFFRPAVQQLAHLLLDRNEDEKALGLLNRASAATESAAFLQQSIVALSEREQFAEIPALCDEAERRSIWAEPPYRQWLAARRADAYYALGNFAESAAWAERVEYASDYKEIAVHLKGDLPEHRRVRLRVPFTKQGDATCAPASLASIAAFWGLDATQDEIADSICYGGTYLHTLRQWAEKRGWIAREFQVTWDAARQLLDRSVPFLLATIDIGAGHMQVVEGYDVVWHRLLIRDPNFRHHRSVEAGAFLKHYEAFGPRGMVVLPPSEEHRLAGLELPFSAGFDRIYKLSLALEFHRRSDAAPEVDALAAEDAPAFQLLSARLALADYDANAPERQKCLMALEAAGLEHPVFTAMRLEIMRDLSSREDRLNLLEVFEKGQDGDSPFDPTFLLQLASELVDDDRQYPRVRRLISRYLSFRPADPSALSLLGKLLWNRSDRSQGIELLRFAAMAGDKNEPFSRYYFEAARSLGDAETALLSLRARVRRYGTKSSFPVQTLYYALRDLNRDEEAFQELDLALTARPEDGDLQIFTANEYAFIGRRASCHELMEKARGRVKRATWLRASAGLAALDGHHEEELSCWKDVVATDPLSLDAHASIARLIATLQGHTASIAYWESLCREFPFHLGFRQFLAQAATEQGDAYAEPYFHQWTLLAPDFAQARSQFIGILLSQGKLYDASRQIEILAQIQPFAADSAFWQGRFAEEGGDAFLAKQHFRTCLTRNVDHVVAAQRLSALSTSDAEQLELANFIEGELSRQVFQYEGLFAWYDLAVGRVTYPDLGKKLKTLRESHSSTWSVWSCSITNCLNAHILNRANEISSEATDRFGLLPGAWLDRASVEERMGNLPAATDSLRRALELNPFATAAWSRFAWILERQDRRDEAEQALAGAVNRHPRNAALRAVWAGVLWRGQRRDEAFAQMHTSLQEAPEMRWAWNHFSAWCHEQKRLAHLCEFTRSLADSRPGDAQLCLVYATTLRDRGQLDLANEILEKALSLSPRMTDAHLFRMELLVAEKRLEEAKKIPSEEIWQGHAPVVLKGQLAWIQMLSGDLDAAIVTLKAAVRQDPTYFWAWERLAEWLGQKNKPFEARNALRRLVQLQPANGQGWHLLAEAEELLGNHKECLRHLKEAVYRDPNYEPAILLYLEKLAAEGRFGDAGKTLQELEQSLSAEFLVTAKIVINLKGRRTSEAVSLFEQLTKMEGLTPQLLGNLWLNAQKAKADRHLTLALDKLVWQPGLRPAAAIWWINLKLAAGTWTIGESVVSLTEEHGVRNEALKYYFNRLLEANTGSFAIGLVQRHSVELKRDDEVWGKVAACLINSSAETDARNWTSDWRNRHEARPWMLQNAAIAAMTADEFAEAFEISKVALESGFRDDSIAFHRITKAMQTAADSKVAEARAGLDGLKNVTLDSWEKIYFEIVDLLIDSKDEQTEPNATQKRWQALRDKSRNQSILAKILDFVAPHLPKSAASGAVPGRAAGKSSPAKPIRTTPPPLPRWKEDRAKLPLLIKICWWIVGIFLPFPALISTIALLKGGSLESNGWIGFGGLLSMAAILATAAGAILAIAAFIQLKGFRIASILAFVANAIAALAGMIFFAALATQHEATKTPSKESQIYRHESGAFLINLKDREKVFVEPVPQAPEQPALAVNVRLPDNMIVSVACLPEWAAHDLPTTAEGFVERELSAPQNDPNVTFRGRITDSKGHPWVRFEVALQAPDGREVLAIRDHTLLNGKAVAVGVTAPASEIHGGNVMSLEKPLEEWKRRVSFPVE